MILWNPPADAGDAVAGLIPGSERSPGEGNSNPLQDSHLGSPMDREAWQPTVHAVTKGLDTTQQLNSNDKPEREFVPPKYLF